MRLTVFLAALALFAVADTASAQSACSHRLLVSGYFSNNVHIYDACSGAFERTLDPQAGRLQGAQALRIGPDGAIWVVSEGTDQVHRYDAGDFRFLSTPIDVGPNFSITGLAFRGETAWAGGYASSTVRTYSLAGQLLGTAVPATTGGRGFDNGMTFGPDGMLYIPGYDTHNIIRHDPATNQNTVLVAASSGGLRNSRGILFRPDGNTFLVSSEGSGQILEYRRDGSFVRQLATNLAHPTGMVFHPDGSLLVVTNLGAIRLDPETGARRDTLVANGSGGLSGPTFALLVPKAAAPVDTTQVGTQYWLTGPGRLVGRKLQVDSFFSATGAAFGAAFNPANVVAKRWGAIEIEFTGCSTATLTWMSSGNDTANFGNGGYALTRFLPGPGTRRCEQAGFAASPAADWLGGTWSGGPARSGEGFVLDYIDDNTVVAAWFTHRPVLD